MNQLCWGLYCCSLLWWNLWVLLQVNGHQIMDEPMEEGESYSHCVSNDRHVCIYLLCCGVVSFWHCLCRMRGHIRRFLSPTLWKRVVRRRIHPSLNCSKSSARALLARWGNQQTNPRFIAMVGVRIPLNFSPSLSLFLSGFSCPEARGSRCWSVICNESPKKGIFER